MDSEPAKVPIVTANFPPFRLVIRGEEDSWDATLEQINGKTYDYVKLHRMSTYLDVGITPFSLGVCYDGTLVLPFTEQFGEREAALSVFNHAIAKLLFGGVYSEAATPEDVGFGTMTLTGYVDCHGSSSGPASSFHKAARSTYIGQLDAIRLHEPQSITTQALESAFQKGGEILSAIGAFPVEQLLYGATFFVRKQWAEALLHLWTVTERLLEIGWDTHVIANDPNVTGSHKAFLNDFRVWTSSAKIEVLYQKSLLDNDLYKSLNRVRKARNSFVHDAKMPTYEMSEMALDVCLEMMNFVIGSSKYKAALDSVCSDLKQRCHPSIVPEHRSFDKDQVKVWLPKQPIPGDSNWGDKEYEIIDELRLQPIKGA